MDSTLNANGAALVKDSSTATFKQDVIDASMEVPVVVDFWATWCGPCKTLGPIIEKVVKGAKGKVKLVKIDIDHNQALAQQLRIQSIPTVYAFWQGRPVDGFMGALPETQVKAFVDKLVHMGGGDDGHADALMAEAKAALDAGDFQQAGGLYQHLLQHEPDHAGATAGLLRCLIGLGQLEDAREFVDNLPPELASNAEVAAARTALEFAEASAGALGEAPKLQARIAADPADHEARLELATLLFGAGQRAEAIDHLLESFRRDREWNEQAARKQLVKLFEAMGPTDPLTLSGRRRLSSLMFS
jgi:putative thioredoxin